jgi:endonuclease G
MEAMQMMFQTRWAWMQRMVLTLSVGTALLFQVGAAAAFTEGLVLGDTPLEGNENIALGMPNRVRGISHDIIISRSQYVLSWNPELRVTNWVAWKLDLNDFGEGRKRSSFRIDPDLRAYYSGSGVEPVRPSDYTGSCLDRGHQVPAADRTASDEDNAATFFMSNMVPQTAWLNRVQWRHGENFERRLVRSENKTVYLIAGGIFGSPAHHIGPNSDIAVPDASYKIIVAIDNGAEFHPSNMIPMLVVKMPNVNSDGSDPFEYHDVTCEESKSRYRMRDISDEHLDQFRTTLADIETLTGFRFFGKASGQVKQQGHFWEAPLPLDLN